MSKLFNKLTSSSAPKVWTDGDFEAIFNDTKCYDFWKPLGRDQATWAAWSSFLERTKSQVDYTTTKSCWFKWVYHHKRNGYPVKTLHLAPAVEKQCLDFIVYYEAKLAEEDKQRELEKEERIKDWQKRKMRVKAESDPSRVAFRWVIPDDEMALFAAQKKEAKDLKRILEETPFDTFKSQIEENYVYDKKTPDKQVVDVIVECTNYGVTYTPEDIQAVNEGKKKIQQCNPIVKEYPVPVVTIDEEAKKQRIALANSEGSAAFVLPPQYYTLSGHTPTPPYVRQKCARDFMKRPTTEGPPTQAETPPPSPTVRTKPT
jgi:hypothetical protein